MIDKIKKQPKKSQHNLFKEAARELECNESEKFFKETLGELIKKKDGKDTRHQSKK